MDDIRRWLESHGLGKYGEIFVDNEIGLDVLADLTMDELKDLEIPLGARKRILKAIAVGTSLPRSEDETNQQLTAPASREAERRQLTVMFCDLVGSTALSESMDPEDYREVITAYRKAASRAFVEHGGYLARFLGDGLLIYFGYPTAYENGPERAARAGLAIVEAVGELDFEPHLEVRVGIATGPVVVGDIIGEGASKEVAVLGETPNLAARLQSAASPNSVLLSPTTQRLLYGRVETEALAPVNLKGLSEPLVPYRALRPLPLSEVSSNLFDSSPLVGRDVELALLERAWRRAESSEGQAVLLTGEAGIGKSRLLRAFRGSTGTDRRRRMRWYCSPYHQTTANYPAIEQLKRAIGLDEANLGGSLERLKSMVEKLGLDTKDTVPWLAHLLSIPAHGEYAVPEYSSEEIGRRVLNAQTQLLLAAARQVSLLFIIEDLHWADPATMKAAGELIAAIQHSRVLVLMTARPEFEPPWLAPSNFRTHRLHSLSKVETRTLVRGIAEAQGLADEIVERIVERTDGVPLFIEEVTKNVLETSGDAGVPSALQDSLTARLDRLGASKEVAQAASIIGRSFTLDALDALAQGSRADVERGLTHLLDSGLVHRRMTGEYEFKHALICDAAYESMLRSPRRKLHGRYADHLQASGAGDRQPEILAQHYAEAGNAEKAVSCWLQAGQRALQHSANLEAIRHLTRGLKTLQTLPDTPVRDQHEINLQLALGSPLFMTRGRTASEVEATYTRAYELCEKAGDAPQRFSALAGLSRFYAWQARFQTAHALGKQCLDLAQQLPDSALFLLDAYTLLGETSFFLGELAPARALLERGVALYEPRADHSQAFSQGGDLGVQCLARLAWTLWLLGFPERALAKCREACSLAQELSHPYSICLAIRHQAVLHVWCRDMASALEQSDALIALAHESGFVLWSGGGMCTRGWALVMQGVTEEGLAQLHQGMGTRGRNMGSTHNLAMLAEAYGKTGQTEAGLDVLAECLEVIGSSKECYYEAEVYRLKGDGLLIQGGAKQMVEEGEANLLRALDIARRQQAKSLELRAAVSLSRLWQKQDRRAEARNLLAGIYDWFTEGFDTADLKDARDLLDSLA